MAATPNNLQVARIKPESSKIAKQNVPAFLNKLATMVSDPETDDLIRWSDDGESFYVPNHERFGRELLPKFFKHGNFSSFVRQLNMYGFHKVPHLQQGVLKNETENELWQFSNPNFKRDFPDLMPLIARKKGTLNIEERDEDGNIIPGTGAGLRTPGAGALDLRTIASGISSIRRHQNAISNELKELQNSNSALWQEALAARERHQQHQETINKILRFLAGVFGPNVGGMGMPMGMPSPASPVSGVDGHKDAAVGAGAVVPRKKQRLMLSDGRTAAGGEGRKTKGKRKAPAEGDEDYASPVSPDLAGRAFLSPANTDANRFTEVTPSEPATTPLAAAGELDPSPNPLPNIKRSQSDQFISPSLLARTRTPVPTTSGPSSSNNNNNNSNSTADQSQVFASTLQALLSSPNSAQRLLASLATMPQMPQMPQIPQMPMQLPQGAGYPPAGMNMGVGAVDPHQFAQLQTFGAHANPYAATPAPPGTAASPYPYAYPMPAQGQFDFSSLPPLPPTAYPSYPAMPPNPNANANAPAPPPGMGTLYQPTAADAQHNQMLQSVAADNAGLQRAYRDTEAINADVDALQESINSLIQSLGIDPGQIQVPGAAEGQGQELAEDGDGDGEDVYEEEDGEDDIDMEQEPDDTALAGVDGAGVTADAVPQQQQQQPPTEFDIEAFLNSLNAAASDPNSQLQFPQLPVPANPTTSTSTATASSGSSAPAGQATTNPNPNPTFDAFFDELSSQGTSSPKSWAGEVPGPMPTASEMQPQQSTDVAGNGKLAPSGRKKKGGKK